MARNDPSLLAHIASRLTTQIENVATDALGFILRSCPAATVALAQRIGVDDRVLDVVNQFTEGNARPDLAFMAGATPRAFLEAKFWAGLTDAQPMEYIRALEVAGGGTLAFVAPSERHHSLWNEIRSRAGDFRCEPNSPLVGEHGKVRIMLLGWADALAAVSSALETPVQRENMNQLVALVRDFEEEGDRPLLPEDLTNLRVPRLVKGLADLSEAIVKQAAASNVVKLDGLRPSNSKHFAGRYFQFSHAGGWLGLSHTYWARFGTSPLWLTFSSTNWGRAADVRRIVGEWCVGENPSAFDIEDGSLAIGVPLLVRAEKARTVNECVRWLSALDQRLKKSGIPPLGPKPVPDNSAQ